MLGDIKRQYQTQSLLRGRDRQRSFESPVDFISPYLALPGLVGFWPVSSIDRSSSQIIDLSGQDRVLSQNGNPLKNYTTYGAPYITLDGGGDYVARADEADLDITGTESDYAAAIRGLTIGCWFYTESIAASFGIFGKYAVTGNQRSYLLYHSSGTPGSMVFVVSSNGTSETNVTHSTLITTGAWHQLVGRLSPSNSLDIFLDGVKTSNTTSIPASIYASTAALQGGAFESANLMTGGLTQMFLNACYLSDGHISSLFEATKAGFGV